MERFIRPPYVELTQRLVPQVAERLGNSNPQAIFEYMSSRRKVVETPNIQRPQITSEDVQRIKRDGEAAMASGDKAKTETLRIWDEWIDSMKAVAADEALDDSAAIDKVLTIFRQQPVDWADFFFEKNVSGASLAEIETIPYPLTPYDARRITRFFNGVSTADLDDNKILSSLNDELATRVVELYRDDYEPCDLANWALLRNIVAWRQHFWHSLLYETDPRHLKLAEDFFNNTLVINERKLFVMRFFGVANPRGEFRTRNEYEHNPFFIHAMNDFRQANSRYVGEYFVHDDEVWQKTFQETFLPGLVERLKELDFYDQTKLILDSYADYQTEPLDEIRALRVGRFYGEDVSANLFEESSSRSGQIEAETITIWEDALKRGLHSLPLHDGVEIIHFSRMSPAYKIGIARIYLNRDSTEANWGLNVRFDFTDPRKTGDQLYVVGHMAHNGKFELSTPLEDMTPGIVALLHRAAVLSTVDISYIYQREEALATARPQRRSEEDPESREYQYTAIPRLRTPVHRRTDRMIEDLVQPKIKMDPRRIGTHPMTLFGLDAYKEAVKEYLQTGDPEPLARARDHMRKPNPQKLVVWPENVIQIILKDPATGETVYGNTWVVEYTKPKLTPDQEVELVLWQRNYRSLNTPSTALSTLGQFADLI